MDFSPLVVYLLRLQDLFLMLFCFPKGFLPSGKETLEVALEEQADALCGKGGLSKVAVVGLVVSL